MYNVQLARHIATKAGGVRTWTLPPLDLAWHRKEKGSTDMKKSSAKYAEHRFRMDHDAQSGLGQPASACIMSSLACSTCSTVREPLLSESTHV